MQRLNTLEQKGWLVKRGERYVLSLSLRKALANTLLDEPALMLAEWERSYQHIRTHIATSPKENPDFPALAQISTRIATLPIWLHVFSTSPWKEIQQQALQLRQEIASGLAKMASLSANWDRPTEESWVRTRDIIARISQPKESDDKFSYGHLLNLKLASKGNEWPALLQNVFSQIDSASLLLTEGYEFAPRLDLDQVTRLAPGKRKAAPAATVSPPIIPNNESTAPSAPGLADIWEGFSSADTDLLSFLQTQLTGFSSEAISGLFFQLLTTYGSHLNWGEPRIAWEGHLWPEVRLRH